MRRHVCVGRCASVGCTGCLTMVGTLVAAVSGALGGLALMVGLGTTALTLMFTVAAIVLVALAATAVSIASTSASVAAALAAAALTLQKQQQTAADHGADTPQVTEVIRRLFLASHTANVVAMTGAAVAASATAGAVACGALSAYLGSVTA